MNEMSPLERRFRRMLAWYPAEHRRTHGEEMIGVLLASASDGQQRPRLADSLDLVGGGLRIRLRAILAGRLSARWTDALAVYPIAVPAIWLVWLAASLPASFFPRNGSPALVPAIFPVALMALVVLPPLLAWRGYPRSAAQRRRPWRSPASVPS